KSEIDQLSGTWLQTSRIGNGRQVRVPTRGFVSVGCLASPLVICYLAAGGGTRDLMDTNDNGSDISLYRYRCSRFEFDEAGFELRVDGELVKLERKPLLVLGELLRHANEVVTRRQLLDVVWGGRPMVDQGLANALVKLRKALKDPPRGEMIATVR